MSGRSAVRVRNPDRTLNWVWFHQEMAKRQAWLDAGRCCSCGGEQRPGMYVVCQECSDAPIEDDYYGPKPPAKCICDWCGKRFGYTTGGSESGPEYPVALNKCDSCMFKAEIPEPENAGQAMLL